MKDFKRNERAGIVKGRLVVVSNQSLDCLFDDNDDFEDEKPLEQSSIDMAKRLSKILNDDKNEKIILPTNFNNYAESKQNDTSNNQSNFNKINNLSNNLPQNNFSTTKINNPVNIPGPRLKNIIFDDDVENSNTIDIIPAKNNLSQIKKEEVNRDQQTKINKETNLALNSKIEESSKIIIKIFRKK